VRIRVTEAMEQEKFVGYLLTLKTRKKICEFFAITNENNTYKQNKHYSMIAEVKAKKIGKRKGASDLCIVLPNSVVFIEMKRRKKILKSGKLSTSGIAVSVEQEKFLEAVTNSNVVNGAICYGYDEAVAYINKFL